MMNNYETVLILNPVLSDEQVKDSMGKFKDLLKSLNAECKSEELWGLKKMKYSIQNKKTGFYMLFEYQDKHAAEFAQKRREKLTSKKSNK